MQLAMTNYASRAPTKEYLICQGQAYVDQNFDRRLHLKSAMIGRERWLVWNFDPQSEVMNSDLQVYLPKFMRVRELSVTHHSDGNLFVTCSCRGRVRYGIPCSCLFQNCRQWNHQVR